MMTEWFIKEMLPAIYRMDVPKWGVLEDNIGYDYTSGVDELNKIWSRKWECPLPPHVPPYFTLPIDCPILT